MTDTEKKNPDDNLKKLTDHFEPTKNTIYERFNLNSCVQSKDTFDAFESKLRMLASSCEYGELTNELTRDRIVIGVTDNTESQAPERKRLEPR